MVRDQIPYTMVPDICLLDHNLNGHLNSRQIVQYSNDIRLRDHLRARLLSTILNTGLLCISDPLHTTMKPEHLNYTSLQHMQPILNPLKSFVALKNKLNNQILQHLNATNNE